MKVKEFFLGFTCNNLTTTKISVTSILYPHFSHDLYHIHFSPFSSYNGYKLNSHLTCFRQGFIAQSVEHRTGIAEVMGSNPVGASELFLGFICNCLSYFRTAKISFTSTILNVLLSCEGCSVCGRILVHLRNSYASQGEPM